MSEFTLLIFLSVFRVLNNFSCKKSTVTKTRSKIRPGDTVIVDLNQYRSVSFEYVVES